jgi:ankyrin repeat protein
MSLEDIIAKCRAAFVADNAAEIRRLISENSELKTHINDPIGPFDSPAINCVRSAQMLDALLDAGADINAKSRWWAGGFGILHTAPLPLAHYAVSRGATVDIHAAARLGLLERVKELIAADPAAVHARGGDGQTPLHFASTVEIADFLLDHGADIDAKDIDHESTPAQWMIEDRQPIVRRLIERNCRTDIFLAAALGDLELAKKHLALNPNCTAQRINSEYFPMSNPHAGGTIYNWTLGWHLSPMEVASKFKHPEVAEFLMEHSSEPVKLISACYAHDDGMVEAILKRNPGLPRELGDSERQQIAHAARNNDGEAVHLMLKAGLPVDARGQHRAPPLYWAAWHGNAGAVRDLLKHGAPLEVSGVEFPGSALSWAIHGSENGWHKDKGDYAATVETLLKAGAKPPEEIKGSAAVREVLQKHRG